ncbi:hypothetical protein TJA_24750 [Thermus sp. LT1-2-5]|uniref:hypothetical protein n=1 Tax=Thermus sp. LT1-2-5 TaxID=3026935 RepID=UPI0030EA9041
MHVARRVLLVLGFLVLALAVLLTGFILSVASHPGPGLPEWKLGRALAPFPLPVAELVCGRAGGPLLCLRGYYRERLKGPVVGNPARPCQGLTGLAARACSEVTGLRLVEGGVSRPLAVCESLPDPLACARYVGRGAFVRGGFEKGGEGSAAQVCAQGKGEVLANCRVGAAMEAVERVGKPILRAAEAFCLPYNQDLCWWGVLSALAARYRNRPQEALDACSLLSPLGAGRCALAFKAR